MKCFSSWLLTEDLGKDGTPSYVTLDDCKESVRHYVYNGRPNEDLLANEVRKDILHKHEEVDDMETT